MDLFLTFRVVNLSPDFFRTQSFLLRIEEFAPFPAVEISKVLQNYTTNDIMYAQEEPKNNGAYTFLQSRFKDWFFSKNTPMHHKTFSLKQLASLVLDSLAYFFLLETC